VRAGAGSGERQGQPVELYLVRHAHAGDPARWSGDDAARPLSGKGRRQAARLGELLAAADLRPGAIVSSPKTRARETAEIVAERLGPRVAVTLDARVADRFDLEALAAIVDEQGRPPQVVVVGHDPDLSDLVAALVGVEFLPMRKGALARVDVAGFPSPGAGLLHWFISPDLYLGSDD
jgi:phosphohistidine phosphatase